jgi:DNA-binding NtrC family response regulator
MRAIIAVENQALQGNLCRFLAKSDTIVETIKDQKHFWRKVFRKTCDLIVVSRHFVISHAAREMHKLKDLPDAPVIVILSDGESKEEKAQFITEGFDAVLNSGLSPEKIGSALNAILDKRRASSYIYLSKTKTLGETKLSNFVANSPAMSKFVKFAARVINSDSTVLILGETGVGKEKLAQAMHAGGPRCKGPFIPVDCGALPESLLESELFGHEEGAFTGAVRSSRGCFELAHSGTIFLDEIGEIPYHLQPKLLRTLENSEIRRVGGEKTIHVDVRIIAATNKDLEVEVKAKQFRKDLYYRLNVVTLTVPPLRERVEDIPELVESYIKHLRPRIGCEVYDITEEALNMLCRYPWPGNVRELINIIERAMLLCEGNIITPGELPETVSKRYSHNGTLEAVNEPLPESGSSIDNWLRKPLKEVRKTFVERLEYRYLTKLLHSTNGHIGQAAKQAGIDERTLFEKMRQYGLAKENFRV